MIQGLTPASQDPGLDQLPRGPPSLGPGPRGPSRAHGVRRGQDQAADRGQGSPGVYRGQDQLQGHRQGLSPEAGARAALNQPRDQRKALTLRENPGKRGS